MKSGAAHPPSAGVTDQEAFLAEVLPMLEQMDKALHNGDARPRHQHWSHRDPVTLLGAATTRSGAKNVHPAFDELAARFKDLTSSSMDVMAAEASGDIGYVVAIENTTCSVGGGPVETYHLRVTTILRREDGAWKIVHRHGSSPTDASGTREQVSRLTASGFR